LIGIAPALFLPLLWVLYLSLFVAGQQFLSFQWDILLLETGFLAMFWAPMTWRWRNSYDKPPSRAVLWLLRILLFRLMFLSGFVKLASGDPAWLKMTALTFHYETQPLPTPVAWYAHQLPPAVQIASCGIMFFIELGLPFFIILPRRPRVLAF